ncbi:hypothetical protein DPM13_15415 [Paracoccus mutanolyticus]|uniref:Uncharacterized protein n=1 Tax=Paracoccus mutanolyticus TaxID=1499308 RepID=A0ABM6WTY9_9RHOB|nr:hypothetical protein DPM13_15415 [Paracoccus mutanolyticus]
MVAAARQAGVHEMIGRLPKGYETPLLDAGARALGQFSLRRHSPGPATDRWAFRKGSPCLRRPTARSRAISAQFTRSA